MSNDTPKRRWYQFSLKTLLVVMTVATVAFGGWVQYWRQQAQENRDRVAAVQEAVVTIEKLGGEVKSEYETLRPQTWLENLFDDPGGPDDPVGVLEVTEVVFLRCGIADSDLKHLEVLTTLKTLQIGGTYMISLGFGTALREDHNENVTDAGLKHLKGLKKLESLVLGYTNVTDEGVKELQQALPNCAMLTDDEDMWMTDSLWFFSPANGGVKNLPRALLNGKIEP